jgi:threonine aldolase
VPVDLRSDTVTRPTPEMRRAMADAEVGDDVYGEDPTVNALQRTFAERLGKAAALFVPSGTMANQLALRLMARPGTLVIADRTSHIVAYEGGASAYNTGAQIHPIDDPSEVTDVIASAHHHQPRPSVVCLENTHMASGGKIVDLDVLENVRNTGLPLHLDGARLWHAEVATKTPVAEWAARATTVMCCLSKGLCAPVGSLLAGDADAIAEARVHRQRLGGGMRQAGVLAAAGLVAINTMVDRLGEDHHKAARLAAAVGVPDPQTNIVIFPTPNAAELLQHLEAHGVLAGTIAPGIVRFVTHRDVDDTAIDHAVAALEGWHG